MKRLLCVSCIVITFTGCSSKSDIQLELFSKKIRGISYEDIDGKLPIDLSKVSRLFSKPVVFTCKEYSLEMPVIDDGVAFDIKEVDRTFMLREATNSSDDKRFYEELLSVKNALEPKNKDALKYWSLVEYNYTRMGAFIKHFLPKKTICSLNTSQIEMHIFYNSFKKPVGYSIEHQSNQMYVDFGRYMFKPLGRFCISVGKRDGVSNILIDRNQDCTGVAKRKLISVLYDVDNKDKLELSYYGPILEKYDQLAKFAESQIGSQRH